MWGEAPCKGKAALFESRRRDERLVALGLCATCPILRECRAEVAAAAPHGMVQAGFYWDEYGRKSIA